MLTGVLLTLGGLVVAAIVVSLLARAWLRQQDIIAERVRIELAQREAERRIEQLTFAAVQRLFDEVRRQH